MDEASFRQAMQKHPEDATLRLVFADWLEEQGDLRGELIRLLHTLTQTNAVPPALEVPQKSLIARIASSMFTVKESESHFEKRQRLENRMRHLLRRGVEPVGPYWTNSLGMKFAWVPAGTFLMGSPPEEHKHFKDEVQHKVTLTKGFYLAVFPVTQHDWQEVMGENPNATSHFLRGDDLPVTRVSWEGSQEFLRELSQRDGHAYRLPTEAEWEYACRAGTTTPFFFGETISTDQANYNGVGWQKFGGPPQQRGVSRGKTNPMDTFLPNAWGLQDMHGNVWEWCSDWYADYLPGDAIDPQGPEAGEGHVWRGGSCWSEAKILRSAYRRGHEPMVGDVYDIGIRPAMTWP